VATHYAARETGGILDGWLVDSFDAAAVPRLEQRGITARAVPLYMSDAAATQSLATATLDLAAAVDRS
jgi:LPPG:FO 2-phospho-L-lactate transferase